MNYSKEVLVKAQEIVAEKDDRSKCIIDFVLEKANTDTKRLFMSGLYKNTFLM